MLGEARQFLWLLFFLLLPVATWADELARAECDSCRFRVESLDHAFSVAGNWLFTRDDVSHNKDVDTDTTSWRVIRVPGIWQSAYADGRNFSTGWYRANFDFDARLIGQEVVFLLDAYMGRVKVFLDGEEVFRRPGEINIERYYSIQPIPVRFKITRPHHVLTIRVETALMKGIYQLPFELRRYDIHDTSLARYQFWGGEARLIASYVTFFFGLFFLMVYWKTSHKLYLVAAINSLVIIPFFAAPGDNLLRIYPPEKLFFLHYIGLLQAYTSYLLSQFFYKFTPRLNWVGGVVCVSLAIAIGSLAFFPDLDLFQKLRGVYLLLMNCFLIAGSYFLFRAVLLRKSGAGILLVGSLTFVVTAVHDTLLALGLIDSVAVLFLGTLALTASALIVASSVFANTFLENRNLVSTLTHMNDNLEALVAERTEKLGTAMNDLGSAHVDLRNSYEQLRLAKDELVRSEKLAALGSLVAGIAHELNTPLGNGLVATTTVAEHAKQLKLEIVERGLRRRAFEEFLATVESATEITLRSLRRGAELVASFKQIAVDPSSSNRGRFLVADLVQEVLSTLKSTVSAMPYRIDASIPSSIELDSFPGPLSQVLTNLINNCLIHAFEGRDHGIIKLSAELADNGRVVLRVQDDGIGIDEENLSKIFDPFFTTKLGRGGSGLGLHIAHNIVTQVLGGSLNVSTELGVGTEFAIDIPLSAPTLLPLRTDVH